MGAIYPRRSHQSTMSTYGSYHSPTALDVPSHAHIPPISTINRQAYNDDSTSLPPMHTPSSDNSPPPTGLTRDSQSLYQGHASSSSTGHGIPSFVSAHQNFHVASSMPTSQAPLYSTATYPSPNTAPSFNHLSSSPSSVHTNGYGQASLPPVSTALYGAPVDNSPLSAYSSANSVPLRASHYQQDDLSLDSLTARYPRQNTVPSNIVATGISHDGSLAASSALAGAKNAEGKFPCQICNKTYQHQKHLKRHNLRHTGERPYRCHLCHETFCRSDILKRHFAKCSIRRGNPEGITHLTHAQDHLKKPSADAINGTVEGQHSLPAAASDNGPRPRHNWPNDGNAYHHMGNTAQHTAIGVNTGSNASSRSSSVIPPGSSGTGIDEKRHHSGTSNTLPPIHTSLETPAQDSTAYNYEQHTVYPRNGYGHNDAATEHGYYQQVPTSSAPFMMPQSQTYSIAGPSVSYNGMTHANAASNGHWLNEPSFQASHHDALMYSGS